MNQDQIDQIPRIRTIIDETIEAADFDEIERERGENKISLKGRISDKEGRTMQVKYSHSAILTFSGGVKLMVTIKTRTDAFDLWTLVFKTTAVASETGRMAALSKKFYEVMESIMNAEEAERAARVAQFKKIVSHV